MSNLVKYALLPLLVAMAAMISLASMRYVIEGANAVQALSATDDLLEFLSGKASHFWSDFAANQLPLYHRSEFSVVTHIVGASIALIAGFAQFVPLIRKRYPFLHRAAGYLYTFSALLGLILGTFISVSLPMIGGPFAILANVVGGTLGVAFIFAAFVCIWNKRYQQHGKWMLRSFAILLTILTVYLMIGIFALFGLTPELSLTVAHLVCFPINLVIAEIIIRKASSNLFL